MDQSLPYGIDDLDPQIVIEPGPPKRIQCFVRGCTESLTPAVRTSGPACPQHGIRCHSSGTFAYEDARRNAIVDADIFGARVIGHPGKYSSDWLGNENSEDMLSWNVFRSIQKAGNLGALASEVLGLPDSKEPDLYLWGILVSDDSFTVWDLLTAARQRFENNLPVKRPQTEPDIALHVPGEYLALIEAKFTSPNGFYQRGPRKDNQSLTLDELLEIYADPKLRLLDTETALGRDRVPYQLWRNTVFADWMALRDSETTKAFHINLVRQGAEEEVAREFTGLLREEHCDRFQRVTWENIYHWANDRSPDLDRMCKYLKQKTARLNRAFQVSP